MTNVDRDSAFVPLKGAHVGILYQMKVSGSDTGSSCQPGERPESLGRTFESVCTSCMVRP